MFTSKLAIVNISAIFAADRGPELFVVSMGCGDIISRISVLVVFLVHVEAASAIAAR
jgi:hypothetical protein